MKKLKKPFLAGVGWVCLIGQLYADGPLGGWGIEAPIRTARLSQQEIASDEALRSGADRNPGAEPGPEADFGFEADEESVAEPGPTQDVPLAVRLESLEEKFDKMAAEADSIGDLKDAVAEIADDKTVVHSGTPYSTMKVSGRVHFDGWGFGKADDNIDIFNANGDVLNPQDPQNRLGFRRLRFGVKGDVAVNMLYKIEMEFAGGEESEFRDAFLGWEELPYLQTLLLGNQKRPYGLDHLNSSRYNVFLERPFVIEAFNEDARRLGLASYGVSDDQRYNWRFGVFNQQKVQGLGNFVGDHLQLELAGRLASTVWYDEVSDGRGYAHLAVSGTAADTNPGNENLARFRTRAEARSANRWINTGQIEDADAFQLLGLESVLNVGSVQLVSEYQTTHVDRINGANDLTFHGGYAQAAYFLTGEHMPWDRDSGTLGRPKPFQNFWAVTRCDGRVERGWGAWQVAARYSYADFNDGVFTGNPADGIFGGKGESFTFGLNWYWNQNARMQFNYLTGGIDNRSVDDGTIRDGDYSIYGSRFMIDF